MHENQRTSGAEKLCDREDQGLLVARRNSRQDQKYRCPSKVRQRAVYLQVSVQPLGPVLAFIFAFGTLEQKKAVRNQEAEERKDSQSRFHRGEAGYRQQ